MNGAVFALLWRQRLCRDWLQLCIWIASIALLAAVSMSAVQSAFDSQAERKNILATMIAGRSILIFRGTPNGTSDGAFTFLLLFTFSALMAGLMSVFLATRHTRGDEEAGRAELIAATPAGR